LGGVGYDRTARSYYARIHTRDATGRRVAHKVRAPTEDAAIEALRGLRARYGVDSAGDEPMGTLSDYLAAWLSSHERTIRPATAASYRSHVTLHIDPLLGGIPLHRLRPSDVDRLVSRLVAKGMRPSSVARVVATLRIALGRAVRPQPGRLREGRGGRVRGGHNAPLATGTPRPPTVPRRRGP